MDNVEKIENTYKHTITCDKCGKTIIVFNNDNDCPDEEPEDNTLFYRIENNSFCMEYNKVLCTSCLSDEKNKITKFLIETGFKYCDLDEYWLGV